MPESLLLIPKRRDFLFRASPAFGTLAEQNGAFGGRESTAWQFGSDGLYSSIGDNVLATDWVLVNGVLRPTWRLERGARTNRISWFEVTRARAANISETHPTDVAFNVGAAAANGLHFPGNTGTNIWAYFSMPGFTSVEGETDTLSAIIEMDDGGEPVISGSSAAGDLRFVIRGSVATDTALFRNQRLTETLWRCSASRLMTAENLSSDNNGINRHPNQSQRSFKVTGYQYEANTTVPSSPIVTEGSAVSRSADGSITFPLTFGPADVTIYRRIRVGSLNTGVRMVTRIGLDSLNEIRDEQTAAVLRQTLIGGGSGTSVNGAEPVPGQIHDAASYLEHVSGDDYRIHLSDAVDGGDPIDRGTSGVRAQPGWDGGIIRLGAEGLVLANYFSYAVARGHRDIPWFRQRLGL